VLVFSKIPNRRETTESSSFHNSKGTKFTLLSKEGITKKQRKMSTVSSPTASRQPTAHPKVAKLVPFLRKVQQLCDSAPEYIARWSADGKQFDVLDPKAFDDLLKSHFEGAAPATFHRQLFFYGWVKLNHSNGGGDERTRGTWSFRHPCFLRDQPSKIYEIRRYARASDREEQDDGSRVDILERRVSALQSLVDDLSRKLAAVQLTLDRTPLAVPPVSAPAPAQVVSKDRLRKRTKDDASFTSDDVDHEILADDLRLSENDLLHLFDDDMMIIEDEAESEQYIPVRKEPEISPSLKDPASNSYKVPTEEEKAHGFIHSIMSTPQFHRAITSQKTMQESKPAPTKVQALPHLSVC